ncbi:MAG: DUF7344 domain-containing protein [Halobacteriota archaeon]
MATTDCSSAEAQHINTVMRVMSDCVRRELLAVFETADGTETATFDALIKSLDRRIPSADREELAVSLRHTHLPLMESNGWLDFDARSGEIRYYGDESIDRVLEELLETFLE